MDARVNQTVHLVVWDVRVHFVSVTQKKIVHGLVECEAYFASLYNECITNCDHNNYECFGKCSREYDENMEKCPCEEGCPQGCPCPDFNCPPQSPVVRGNSVLVLNTYRTKQAVIIDSNGKEELPTNDFMFLFGENTEVYTSCHVTFRGDLFIYGGVNQRNQVSKLVGCKLERIFTLPFSHYYGSCANHEDKEIFLCFNESSDDYKKCRSSTQPTGEFTEVAESNFPHKRTALAASPG